MEMAVHEPKWLQGLNKIQAFAGPELEVSVWLRAFLIYGFKYKRTNVCIRG